VTEIDVLDYTGIGKFCDFWRSSSNKTASLQPRLAAVC